MGGRTESAFVGELSRYDQSIRPNPGVKKGERPGLIHHQGKRKKRGIRPCTDVDRGGGEKRRRSTWIGEVQRAGQVWQFEEGWADESPSGEKKGKKKPFEMVALGEGKKEAGSLLKGDDEKTNCRQRKRDPEERKKRRHYRLFAYIEGGKRIVVGYAGGKTSVKCCRSFRLIR